jgi:hypothetical protein
MKNQSNISKRHADRPGKASLKNIQAPNVINQVIINQTKSDASRRCRFITANISPDRTIFPIAGHHFPCNISVPGTPPFTITFLPPVTFQDIKRQTEYVTPSDIDFSPHRAAGPLIAVCRSV